MENLYVTKVLKIGNSLGVVIPKEILVGIHMQRGDYVVFSGLGLGRFTARHLTDIEIKELKFYTEETQHLENHD